MRSEDSESHDVANFNLRKLKDYDSKVPRVVEFKVPFMKLSVNAIESLDIKKSAGLIGMSPRILKRASKVISPTLLKMINISINTGNFLDNLKIAKLISIQKGGAKNDPSNYRLIFILSVLSKLLETHVTKHLFAYFKQVQPLT